MFLRRRLAFTLFRAVTPIGLNLLQVMDAMKMHDNLWVGEQQSVCTLQLTLSKIDKPEKMRKFPC